MTANLTDWGLTVWQYMHRSGNLGSKEWKSYNRLKGFVTGQKAITEGRAGVGQPAVAGVEATSGVTWWLPILEAVARRAISEIRERLEWAVDFLSKNSRQTKQRKSIKNKTLEGILIAVFS
jgi:hypothetical protein